jgi:hypothetical protein
MAALVQCEQEHAGLYKDILQGLMLVTELAAFYCCVLEVVQRM